MSDKVAEIPQDVKDKIEKEYPFPERTYYRGAGFSGWPETERMRKVREGAEFGYSLAQQEIERLEKSEAGWKAAFEILEYLIKKKAESQEEFRRFCNTLTKEIQNNL